MQGIGMISPTDIQSNQPCTQRRQQQGRQGFVQRLSRVHRSAVSRTFRRTLADPTVEGSTQGWRSCEYEHHRQQSKRASINNKALFQQEISLDSAAHWPGGLHGSSYVHIRVVVVQCPSSGVGFIP